jgi:hypothetical protein
VLHVLGALLAPGLHLHAHGDPEAFGAGWFGAAAQAASTCCGHEHEVPTREPVRPGTAELELPAHDEEGCAFCAMAHWTATGAPRVVECPAPHPGRTASAAAPAVEPKAGERSRTWTRGPPEDAS